MLLGPVPLPTQFQRREENNADTDASSLELRLFVNGSPGQCGNALDFLSESCFLKNIKQNMLKTSYSSELEIIHVSFSGQMVKKIK